MESSMARRTITIPAKMDAQMKATSGVNWSACAQECFQKKLDEIEVLTRLKEDKEMLNAVERLRKSKEEVVDNDVIYGKSSGSQYVKMSANYDALLRLEELKDNAAGYDDDFNCLNIAAAIEPDVGSSHNDADEIWDNFLEIDRESISDEHAFCRGFVEGAIEVFNELKEHI